MGALQILMLILSCAAGVFVLVVGCAALSRDLRNGRAWKRAEPEVLRAIREVTGQPVEHRMMLNASLTNDFSPRTIFWLWLGFTRDHIVAVQRDWEDDGSDTAPQWLVLRREATLRREGKRFAKLTLRDIEGGKTLTLWLCVPPRRFEELSRLVPTAHLR